MPTNTTAKMPPAMQAQNGVITAPPKGVVGGNRKKQKRREKQAAKVATQEPTASHDGGQAADGAYDDDQLEYPEDDEYSDDPQYDEDERYAQHPAPNGHIPQHHVPPPDRRPKNGRKKKQAPQGHLHRGGHDSGMLPPLPHAPPPRSRASRPGQSQPAGHHHHPNIWNTSSQQERQNIKDFWLSLSEDERKALLKIEKEAVLKKMKQQQKHSCSCTVCGRKRTAIEEELEVLYEGYYEELEQYAHHDQPPLPDADGMMPDPLQHRRPHPLATPPPTMQYRKTSHLHEHLDEEEEEEYSDDGEEEYSDDDEEDDEEYSDEDPEPEPEPPRAHQGVPDFFNFGSHLTVKDNLLTVADDLLKNDGRKFIEMMEQLAERRMQRETRSQYEAEHQAYPSDDPAYGHGDPLAEGDDFDDDEGSYDSQEEYDDDMDEEDEMVGDIELEGRRMFQIFAARMFEQRVLQAYREKVAAERQRKLLEELEDEDKQHAEREAKRQRDAQKKKDKKKQQQQAKAEEKAKRDAEKAAEEARLKEAEEKKLEEQRRKKEEQRRKREEEKRKQEEERARKEAEKLRRQQEEQQRREEAERKAREQKAAEKAKKEEARRKEREEREAREKEAREHKAHVEKERREHEAKLKAEKDRQKTNQPTHANPPHITKRTSQPGMVAIPGQHPKNVSSPPHPTVATPAVPKQIITSKQRQPSQQGSHASSPKGAQSQLSGAPSKSSSPGNSGPTQNPIQPKVIMQKGPHPSGQFSQPPMPTSSPLPPHHPLQPPPGMPHMQQQHTGAFPGMGPMGFQGFPGPQGLMMPNHGPRGQMPMFPQQGPHMGMPNRMPFGPGMNGIGPPGMMMQPNHRAFPFDAPGSQPPPGFGHAPHPALPPQTSPIGPPQAAPGAGHSRQPSLDKERFESTANQPISRPAPIKRPGTDKSPAAGQRSDVDDLSKHLGSSALLDDTDDPMPPSLADVRRHSSIAPGAGTRNISIPSATLGQMAGGFGNPVVGNPLGPAPFANWNGPGMTGMPFGQSPNLAQPNWGSLPNGSLNHTWSANNNAFAPNAGNSAFGSIGGHPGQNIHRPSAVGLNRPLTIRLAVCQACKQLSNTTSRARSASKSASPDSSSDDGFHDVNTLLRQIESNRPMLDAPPTLGEIEEICETEGDHQNGGGELYVRRGDTDGRTFSVKWEPDVLTPEVGGRSSGGAGGLGEIGSPLPSKTSPAGFGFGAPGRGRVVTGGQGHQVFQGLGAV